MPPIAGAFDAPMFAKFEGVTIDPAAPLTKKPKNHKKRLRQAIQNASLMMSL